MGARDDELRSGYASLTQMLRSIEEKQMTEEEREVWGLWTWAKPEVLTTMMASAVNEVNDICEAPDFDTVRRYPYAGELLSLRKTMR